jgi:hypothetical protein
MTIGLGVLGTNGVVLCADTEISTDGEVKGVDTKLVAATSQMYGEPQSIVIGGAGSLGYFQSLRMKVTMAVLSSLQEKPFLHSNVERALEGLMVDFYSRHVIPFSNFQNPPEVEIMVGISTKQFTSLYATERTAVRPCIDGFDAIGIGGVYAKNILHGYYRPMSVESAALLACYVMMRVKSSIRDCGRETQLIVLRDGENIYFERPFVLKCEDAFENYAVFQQQALYAAIGVTANTVPIKDGIDAMRQDFDNLRHEINARTSSKDQT